MNEKRLALALDRMRPTDWARFEKFASAFLVGEFPNLRTMASPSGDGGVDAMLFSPDGWPGILLQYSLTDKWNAKVKGTAKRLKTTRPDATQLIYVSNREIGALADKLRLQIRLEYGVALDVRDRSYFLERFQGSQHLEEVAERLAADFVDPLLRSEQIIDGKAQALTAGENRAAHLYLALQWEDDTRDKGLTKTAFDGLVRMCLRSTDSENRLSKTDIQGRIRALLQSREPEFVIREVDKSLVRLTKQFIRHDLNTETFWLTFQEITRIKDRLAEREFEDRQLAQEIESAVLAASPEASLPAGVSADSMIAACRLGLDRFLLQRGELFVSALENGQAHAVDAEAIRAIANEVLADRKLKVAPLLLARSIERVLRSSSPTVEKYLRGIADTYTLLAFLKETPDVQRAVQKMFSDGEIWLDANIVLPLLAEDLAEDNQGHFRRLIKVADVAGLKIKVAVGVLEEVERHINRALTCAKMEIGAWIGQFPYLYAVYIASGASSASFSSWIGNFCGDESPEDDLADYLKHHFKIDYIDITQDALRADQDLRGAVKEAWLDIHTKRRTRFGAEFDPGLAMQLANHDTDSYVGVIARRQPHGASAFGYSSWWLTLDSMAFGIQARIEPALAKRPPPSPVMSADFLSNYLAFGPLRHKAAKEGHTALPVWLSTDLTAVQEMTPELIAIAAAARKDAGKSPEIVIRRKVRDALNAAKRRTGQITAQGLRPPAALPGAPLARP